MSDRRQQVIDTALAINAHGINRGAAGEIRALAHSCVGASATCGILWLRLWLWLLRSKKKGKIYFVFS